MAMVSCHLLTREAGGTPDGPALTSVPLMLSRNCLELKRAVCASERLPRARATHEMPGLQA
eukprot:CAMPEP_0197889312 /NCGR_PEP_ID=MMETSP1439-20131203/24276_1 /TAXON_ID=66791 /ORGANISM="Gonyaulax spinifera, Strain CCMP409" /LENGTH=60 /DNA_ID=CAMNT_0043509285 /DNA_START=65 /DNA_END=244 /DNA_ORIENTATION=-